VATARRPNVGRLRKRPLTCTFGWAVRDSNPDPLRNPGPSGWSVELAWRAAARAGVRVARPQADIRRLKERHGWEHIPWYTITDDFDKDFDVDEWHGTNAPTSSMPVWRRADGNTWNYLDITALGCQEEWEDSPRGLPANHSVPVVELPRRVWRGQVMVHSPFQSATQWRAGAIRVTSDGDRVGQTSGARRGRPPRPGWQRRVGRARLRPRAPLMLICRGSPDLGDRRGGRWPGPRRPGSSARRRNRAA
jgi:Bacterial protein of unknown function (DUF899)